MPFFSATLENATKIKCPSEDTQTRKVNRCEILWSLLKETHHFNFPKLLVNFTLDNSNN